MEGQGPAQHRQIEEVADIEKSYQWLDNAGLRDSTEALIMAAQEQGLKINRGRGLP